MSNKDINNQHTPKTNSHSDLPIKDTMHLFSLSLLKSDKKITVLPFFNSFNYNFSKDNEMKKRKKKDKKSTINNRIISLIEDDNNSSLKTLNIEVPSAEKLSDENFKNDFLNNYENSFSYYCGINKKQYRDIYINNRYIPVLDDFLDINISIKNIVNLIKTYSVNEKVGRKTIKRNRIKKIFKTSRKKAILDKKEKNNRFLFAVKKKEEKENLIKNEYTKNINDIKKSEIINLKELDNNKIDDTKKENYNNNNMHPPGLSINNIKHRLIQNKGNILIPKITNQKIQLNKGSFAPVNTSSLGLGNLMQNPGFIYNYNTLTNDGNKRIINNINNPSSFGLVYPSIPESKQNISPSNNNIFNFSNKNIQKIQNIQNVISNNMNANFLTNPINNTNTNLNYNLQINNQLLSPQHNYPLTPILFNNDMFTPFSPQIQNSNLSTPRTSRIQSPNFNNFMLRDHFNYNNINGNSFFFGNNSPATINNNNININNNIIENNLINNINNNNNDILRLNNEIGKNINNNISNNINNNINKKEMIDFNNLNNNNKNQNQNNNHNNFLRKNLSHNLKINLNL